MFSICLTYFLTQAGMSLSNMYLTVMLKNQHFSYVLIGLTMALFELSGIVGPLATGSFVDRTGRSREAIVLSAFACVASLCLVTWGGSVLLSLFAFIILGFFLRSILPLQDAKALSVTGGNMRKYSASRSVETLGCAFYSLVYALIRRPHSESNVDITLFTSGGIALFMAAVFFTMKDEEPPVEPEEKRRGEARARWYDRAFLPGLFFLMLSRFALTAVTFLSLYMVEELNSDQFLLMQVVSTLCEFIAMISIGRLLQSGKISSVMALSISSLAIVARLCCYAFIPTLFGVVLGQCLHSLCYGFFQPASMAFVTEHVKEGHRAEGVSMCQAIGSGLSAMVGSSVAGALIGAIGYKGMFLAFCVPALAAGFLFFLFRRSLGKRFA